MAENYFEHTFSQSVSDVLCTVDMCHSCEDIAQQSCTMVRRWRLFASCISSEQRAARFRPAF